MQLIRLQLNWALIVAKKMINLIWCFKFQPWNVLFLNSRVIEFHAKADKVKVFHKQTTGEDRKCLARNLLLKKFKLSRITTWWPHNIKDDHRINYFHTFCVEFRKTFSSLLFPLNSLHSFTLRLIFSHFLAYLNKE